MAGPRSPGPASRLSFIDVAHRVMSRYFNIRATFPRLLGRARPCISDAPFLKSGCHWLGGRKAGVAFGRGVYCRVAFGLFPIPQERAATNTSCAISREGGRGISAFTLLECDARYHIPRRRRKDGEPITAAKTRPPIISPSRHRS